MIAFLWQNRDHFPVGSDAWIRAWCKRLIQLPQVLRQFLAHQKLRRMGALVHESAYLSDVNQINGQLRLLEIGSETFIGRSELSVFAPVFIGSRVCINDGAKVLSASHDIRHENWPRTASSIRIEDYAWIATNAIILPGVTIGRGAVIGAGAVVSRDVPAGAVATGNPARIVPDRRAPQLDYSPTASLAMFTAWRKMQGSNHPSPL